MNISVITATVRQGGLDEVKRALKRQTMKEFEWVVVSPNRLDGDFIYVQDPPKNEGDYWSLNKAMNEAIRKSSGELIVSWQDFTFADPDTLEKFWQHYQDEPKTLVTCVGNKYVDNTYTVETWKDPRITSLHGTFYPCYFNDIEFNLNSVPRIAYYSVGGWDEYLDKYAGMDGYSVVDRLNIQGGWNFKIDQTIHSYSLEHGRLPSWDEKNALGLVYNKHRESYLANCKLDYLK